MLKAGDILETEIISQGKDGEGIARIDGYVLFVPLTLKGEKVKVSIVSVTSKYAVGKVIKMLEPAPYRIQPECPVFFKCGGCAMQHLPYEKELEIKRDNIRSCMEKAGVEAKVDPVVPSPAVYGYRNKAQVPVAQSGSALVAGYFKRASHCVVPLPPEGCRLHDDVTNSVIFAITDVCNKHRIPAYNETTRTGLIRHILIRRTGEIYNVCLVINGSDLPHKNSFVSAIAALGIKFSLSYNINTRNTNVITGEEVRAVYGDPVTRGNICGIETGISPLSFMQVNDAVCEAIYRTVQQTAAALAPQIIVDAYGGVGIMSNLTAQYCKHVYCIEIVPSAIEDGKRISAEAGNADKITHICGDAAVILPSLPLQGEKSLVILDPPRKGCEAAILDCLNRSDVDNIIYVSCNPATLARDLAQLRSSYAVTSVTPFDMFPRTSHIETLVCLQRK